MYKITCEHCGDEIVFEGGPSFVVIKNDPTKNKPGDLLKQIAGVVERRWCKCVRTCVLTFERED